MSALIDGTAVIPPDLAAALESEVCTRYGQERQIADLRARNCEYASSFALQELDLVLDNGRHLPLVVKALGPAGLLAEGRAVRPDQTRRPLGEIEIYRDVLSGLSLGTADFFAVAADAEKEQQLLILERVEGPLLWQTEGLNHWLAASRWLARFHASCPTRPANVDRYDRDYCRSWLRLVERVPVEGARALRRRHLLRRLAASDSYLERFCALPQALLHGDFFPANIIVSEYAGRLRLCPIDWEMAVYGPCLLDLAALTSGKWTMEQRQRISRAYFDLLHPNWYGSFEAFKDALDLCALQLAVQFLAWPEKWTRPAQQEYDWLAEAERLADRVL